MELRYYQKEALKAINNGWADFQKQLLVMATGCGKTVVFDTFAAEMANQGRRVLILAHRDELIEQARDKYRSITGGETSKEKAKETSIGSPLPVVVGSVQTMSKDERLNRFSPTYFDIIIVDEAHHTLAKSYLKILEHFPGSRVLGVTATPDRGDKKNLATFYENTAYDYSLKDAIEDKFLCPITARTVPLSIDIKNVKISGGDYELRSTADALRPYLGEIAKSIKEYAKDRKTLVFLPLIEIAQELQEFLEKEGVNAREINNKSPNRKEILDWFDQAGKGSVLCNAMLLTEGYDCPSCDCVVVLRPTKIRSLFAQMVGRGTRLCPGKENLLLLDYLWLTERHNLCRPADLVTDNKADADEIKEASENGEVNIFDVVVDRRRRLAEALLRNKSRKSRAFDPLNWLECIGDTEGADHAPIYAWEGDPMTEKQKLTLIKNGIEAEEVTKGMASLIIANIIKRCDLGLATPKQMGVLIRAGYKNVGNWSFALASQKITELAENNWNTSLLEVPPQYFRPTA